MSSRVTGAGLALIAVALLAVSVATPAVLPAQLSLFAGHPTVSNHTRETQDVYVGLYTAELCNSGGDGTCKTGDATLPFRLTGYGELALSGGLALLSITLALLTLRRSEARKTVARLVWLAGALAIGGAAALILLGPFHGASAPIGLGMILHGVGLLTAVIGAAFAARPPPPIRLRVADRASPPHALPTAQAFDRRAAAREAAAAARAADAAERLGFEARTRPPPPPLDTSEPLSDPFAAPLPTGERSTLPSGPQLRPLYEAAPLHGGTGGLVPPERPAVATQPPPFTRPAPPPPPPPPGAAQASSYPGFPPQHAGLPSQPGVPLPPPLPGTSSQSAYPGAPPQHAGLSSQPGVPPPLPGMSSQPGIAPPGMSAPTYPGIPPQHAGLSSQPGVPPPLPGMSSQSAYPGVPPQHAGLSSQPGVPPPLPGTASQPGVAPPGMSAPTYPGIPPQHAGLSSQPGVPPPLPGTASQPGMPLRAGQPALPFSADPRSAVPPFLADEPHAAGPPFAPDEPHAAALPFAADEAHASALPFGADPLRPTVQQPAAGPRTLPPPPPAARSRSPSIAPPPPPPSQTGHKPRTQVSLVPPMPDNDLPIAPPIAQIGDGHADASQPPGGETSAQFPRPETPLAPPPLPVPPPPGPRSRSDSQLPPPLRGTQLPKPPLRAAVPMPARAGRATGPTQPPGSIQPPGSTQPPPLGPAQSPVPSTLRGVPLPSSISTAAAGAVPAIPAIPPIPAPRRPDTDVTDPDGESSADLDAATVSRVPIEVGEYDSQTHVSVDLPLPDDGAGAARAAAASSAGVDQPTMLGPAVAVASRPTVQMSEQRPDAPIAPSPSRTFTPHGRGSMPNLPISTAPDSLPPPKDHKQALGPSPACPQCESPMAWVEEHLRFYCKSCRMYF
jgi:hypothetical protein